MNSDTSVTETVVIRRDRSNKFCKEHGKMLVFIMTPIILMPIAFIGEHNAYLCFYVFLITAVYWTANVFHPGVIGLISFAILLIASQIEKSMLIKVVIPNVALETFGAMCFIEAIENSKLQKHVAIKILIFFGCSHYRLSFLVFFTTMITSMWFSSTTVCAFMIPLTKSILMELERLGLIEVYKIPTTSNNYEITYEEDKPADLTIFYFLGIAYSSSIGAMATYFGSETNQIFKIYYNMTFPMSSKMEFPHFMLLTLPAVLILEAFLYFWMNFYFLGMFRSQSNSILRFGMLEEETQYVHALLTVQYKKLGSISFHKMIVGAVLILTLIMQSVCSSMRLSEKDSILNKITAPSIIAIAVLFVMPRNLDCIHIFRRSGHTARSYTACLTWSFVNNGIQWSVLLVIVSTETIFEALKLNGMTDEFEKFLLLFKGSDPTLVVLVIVLLCKILTEFVSNTCLVYCLLPHIAKASIILKINPHYLMMSAVLASSLPFHLIPSTPANALVSAYVNIPHRKMLSAGTGLSVIGVIVVWLTVTLWSKVIWFDISQYSNWVKSQEINVNP